METQDNDHAYVTVPVSGVHTAMQQNMISHEEICEPNGRSQTEVDSSGMSPNIATQRSDEEEEKPKVFPMYVKQEEQQPRQRRRRVQQQPQHQYTSGDDESMAVEALRQLGGMYPCFEEKKISCPNCAKLFTQTDMAKHNETCESIKLSCTTCGERFERKQDLNNHIVCHQVDRPHACRTCGNLFRSKANLLTHMSQVHQTEKPHKCTICGADFQRPSSLSNHMKIHTYVAGRAIMQSQASSNSQSAETFGKWPENEPQNSSITSSSVQSISNYDVSQVQWSVPSYNFANDQTTTLAIGQEKIDDLQEFTVMPNGEVTQFEYGQQTSMPNQYSISINSFGNSNDSMVKVESIPFVSESERNYVEIEINDSSVKSHTCSHCGVSFSRATALASHEKIHGGKNWTMPIECEFCDKQFQDANHLATHQTTCAKKLMQNNMEQGVSNGKWGKHACTECGKKFTTKQKMFR